MQLRLDGEFRSTHATTHVSTANSWDTSTRADFISAQNASYIYGTSLLSEDAKAALAQGLFYEEFTESGGKAHL